MMGFFFNQLTCSLNSVFVSFAKCSKLNKPWGILLGKPSSCCSVLKQVLQTNNSLNVQGLFRWLKWFAVMGHFLGCGGYFFSALLNSQNVSCTAHLSSIQIFSFLFVYCWLALKLLKEVHHVLYKELNCV